ncbi:MAG: GntR family transcriptional regulator [Galactobacter sp.]|uniref:GntR family transcriptional regulator n=1 Tax=Galactobacter sp. TaxID=2676125 RepID=UPI0025C1527B|nr:GntR family transcriptional regulator [Galactobacter sp.]
MSEQSVLAPLGREKNLRDIVTDKLRAAIMVGELAEGTTVSAPTLGAQLGVSATPVREAMMDLAREGMVETQKNKGFRITSLSNEELLQITDVRLLLEPPAMPRAIGNLTPEVLAQLRDLADLNLKAAREEDLENYLLTDRDFHALILSQANNPVLADLCTSLRLRTRLYGLRSLADLGLLEDSALEHHRLIDLLEAGDGAGAEELLRAHIGHATGSWQTGSKADHVAETPTNLQKEAPLK